MTQHKSRGVTLIEMVMVVAILGIVTAIAYPNYLDRSRRANRIDAKAALLNVAALQERFFLRNNTYSDSLTALGVTGTENGFYSLSITRNSPSEFTATAVPAGESSDGGQWLDETCQRFEIDQLGRKAAFGNGNADNSQECWQR